MIEDKAKAFIDNLVLPTALRIVPLPTIPKIKVKTYNLKKGNGQFVEKTNRPHLLKEAKKIKSVLQTAGINFSLAL